MSKTLQKQTSRKSDRTVARDDLRASQFQEFLDFCAKQAGSRNADHYLASGSIENEEVLRQIGMRMLNMAFGFEMREWIPYIGQKGDPQMVPQSEDYYPWVLYVLPSSQSDLREFFDKIGREYLLSESAGAKKYVVATNAKHLMVFDLNHYIDAYDISFSRLLDDLQSNANPSDKKTTLYRWANLLRDLGPSSAEAKKKKRRAEVINYQNPNEANARLEYVKRFGHMPDFRHPIGWDGKNFTETFKTKNLPFFVTEKIEYHSSEARQVENRLIWGDNLSVMRCLPSESIDLIYIDPPFFSGRNYNCIFGDDDEVRTFSDIWDGGLPTYLAWLNARLWEMKRLLKPSGNILVHLDWHAVHYVKVEMDKIFGYENFRNEIVWHYSGWNKFLSGKFESRHDNILLYAKSGIKNVQKWQGYGEPWESEEQYVKVRKQKVRIDEAGRKFVLSDAGGGKRVSRYLKEAMADGRPIDDVWRIDKLNNSDKERIGYPTQKPESLLSRIIQATTEPGDVVADFFSGGGTTCAVAAKLGRKWIGSDISRVAISVARDRIAGIMNDPPPAAGGAKLRTGFSVESHGSYERNEVRNMPIEAYKSFILTCYDATQRSTGDLIHGFRSDRAIHVASPKSKVGVQLLEEFHEELSDRKIDEGVILAWGYSKDAEDALREIRRGNKGPDIQLVQVSLVDIDSHEFKGDNIRFLNKPAALIKAKHLSGRTWKFDASASTGTNDVPIHRFQWDFDHKKHFTPSIKDSFKDDDGDGNPFNDYRSIEYTFPNDGKFKVALKIFDKLGAEATEEIVIENAGKGELAS